MYYKECRSTSIYMVSPEKYTTEKVIQKGMQLAMDEKEVGLIKYLNVFIFTLVSMSLI